MSRFFKALAVLAAILGVAPVSVAGKLAHVGQDGVTIEDSGGEVLFSVPLTEAVPWRVSTADNPPRLIIEFSDLAWSGSPDIASATIAEVRMEKHAANWSRMVAMLREPLAVAEAEMATGAGGTAVLRLRLTTTTAAVFRETAGALEAAESVLPNNPDRIVVAIDPGHGGLDPGAEAGDLQEADLTLSFARRLKEDLVRTGRFEVVLTREEDVFVSLEERLTRARTGRADVFLSLHADALTAEAGAASGMTVYTLAPDAENAATDRLTERHSGTDILSGVDLSGAGDDVSGALVDLARQDTGPRAAVLSATLIEAFQAAELAVNSRPERQGDFSVLKLADTPSVLIELGFLSSEADLARLSSEKWVQEASRALRDGLLRWQDEDRLQSEALRK